MDYKEEVLPIGKRITLHRSPSANIRNTKLQENLKILKFNMHGKQLAQQLYYEKPGQSPLLRNIKSEHKKPVHERLGVRNMRRPKAYDFTTSTPIIRNKRYHKDGLVNYTKRNFFKRNLAQARIQRIRQQRIADDALSTSLLQKIRARRYKQQSGPINYTVQVKNENAYNGNIQHSSSHSVHGSLNFALQEEIKIIQSQNVEHNIIPNTPIFTIGYGVTNKSLHNRFTSLP